ncbi:MAG: hypothetical protein JNM50_15175 [Chromatiales bacterium]|jgi:hypothetical protein|nr:hypothetical protein [Chromatiales bacterium]
MAEQKGRGIAPALPARRTEAAPGSYRAGPTQPPRNGTAPAAPAAEGKDVASWDSYRRWLSRVQLPDKRRIAMDPSLYTWKGYRSWAEKVRRDWTPEDE